MPQLGCIGLSEASELGSGDRHLFSPEFKILYQIAPVAAKSKKF